MPSSCIIFDTGPIISLTTNNLLWLLEPMKKKFGGEFYITPSVKKELVDVPLETKKFKFEALQVLDMIERGILKIVDQKAVRDEGYKLLQIANQCFQARGKWLQLLQTAEMEVIAAALLYGAEAVMVDERTMRMIIEDPQDLKNVLESRLHMHIEINKNALSEIRKRTREIRLLRSTELVMAAYELGLLDQFVGDIPHARKQLLQSVLWGLKIRGCSVTVDEIDEAVEYELKR